MSSRVSYHTKAEPCVSDPIALALQALGWIASDQDRLDRLLAMTGLDAAGLRARATDPALLAAALAFLEGHEPDLLACAAAVGHAPAALVDARAALER